MSVHVSVWNTVNGPNGSRPVASSRSPQERGGGESAQRAVGNAKGVGRKWAALSWLVQERLKASPCCAQGDDQEAAGSGDEEAERSALGDLEPAAEGVRQSIRQGNAMGRRNLALLLKVLNEGLSDCTDAKMRWRAVTMLKDTRGNDDPEHAPLVRGAMENEERGLSRLSSGGVSKGAGEHADEAETPAEMDASRDVTMQTREDGCVIGRSAGRDDETPEHAGCGEYDACQEQAVKEGKNPDAEEEADQVVPEQILTHASERAPEEEALDGGERSAGEASAGSTVQGGHEEFAQASCGQMGVSDRGHGVKRCEETRVAVGGARKQVPRTIVTAAWDYHAEAEDELTFAAGDRFVVLDRGEDQGWVYAEHLRRKDELNDSGNLKRQRKRGLIPTTHLQALLAAWDWEAMAEDELSFQSGDKLIVLDSADDVGWLYAELQPTESNGSTKRGLVPTTHLVLLEQEDDDAFEDVDTALEEVLGSQVDGEAEPSGGRAPQEEQDDRTGSVISPQVERGSVEERAGMDVDASQGAATRETDHDAAKRAVRSMTPRLEGGEEVEAGQDTVAADQLAEMCPGVSPKLASAAVPSERGGTLRGENDQCAPATQETEDEMVQADDGVSGIDGAQAEPPKGNMGHGTKEEFAEATKSRECRFCNRVFINAAGRISHEKSHQALALNPGAKSRLKAGNGGGEEEPGESKKRPGVDISLAAAASSLLQLRDKFVENALEERGCMTRRAVSGRAARDKQLVGHVLDLLGSSNADGRGKRVDARGGPGEGEQGGVESRERGEDLFVDLLGVDGNLDEDEVAARNLSVRCLAERLLAWRGLAPGSHENVVAAEFCRLRNAMQVGGFGLR